MNSEILSRVYTSRVAPTFSVGNVSWGEGEFALGVLIAEEPWGATCFFRFTGKSGNIGGLGRQNPGSRGDWELHELPSEGVKITRSHNLGELSSVKTEEKPGAGTNALKFREGVITQKWVQTHRGFEHTAKLLTLTGERLGSVEFSGQVS